jgi:hypothetical protein
MHVFRRDTRWHLRGVIFVVSSSRRAELELVPAIMLLAFGRRHGWTPLAWATMPAGGLAARWRAPWRRPCRFVPRPGVHPPCEL